MGRLSPPPDCIGSYQSISENSDKQTYENKGNSTNSQAYDVGSIPFTRSNHFKAL